MKAISVCLLSLALSLPLSAKELHGFTFDDKVEFQGQTLQLNGLGVRLATLLKIKVYVAGLYLVKQARTTDEVITQKENKVLEMRFLTGVSKDQLRDAWSEGFKNNLGAEGFDKIRSSLQTLNSYMTALNKNQVMKFATAGDKIYVTVKGEEKPPITDAYLAENFFKVFLGVKPPNEELKKGLLGQM